MNEFLSKKKKLWLKAYISSALIFCNTPDSICRICTPLTESYKMLFKKMLKKFDLHFRFDYKIVKNKNGLRKMFFLSFVFTKKLINK